MARLVPDPILLLQLVLLCLFKDPYAVRPLHSPNLLFEGVHRDRAAEEVIRQHCHILVILQTFIGP